VVSLCGKCPDSFEAQMGAQIHEGYILGDLGIDGADYIAFDLCIDCGQLQGEFPRPRIPELEPEPIKCQHCGGPMVLVIEGDPNSYLVSKRVSVYRCEGCGKEGPIEALMVSGRL
jgi:DNA-directed RNA polymerase subunit RPC12/RpoP